MENKVLSGSYEIRLGTGRTITAWNGRLPCFVGVWQKRRWTKFARLLIKAGLLGPAGLKSKFKKCRIVVANLSVWVATGSLKITLSHCKISYSDPVILDGWILDVIEISFAVE